MRERIQKGTMNTQFRAEVLRRLNSDFPGKGVFARSSTNSEDLPNFSGAGLYSTAPNVRGDSQLIDAIRFVWASVWNYEAYEARERAGIDHTKIFMAVLIQEGINSESSGVMITADPFNREGTIANQGSIYISAKRGLGIKVVEGKKVAEQIVFRPNANGGVKEIPIGGERVVLTDDVIRRLAAAAAGIKRIFGGEDQDIEWAYMKGQIYIVQARPFISGG
jgi:phosphoenolpyruvate synthase/pyruvate phosphate dikinase